MLEWKIYIDESQIEEGDNILFIRFGKYHAGVWAWSGQYKDGDGDTQHMPDGVLFCILPSVDDLTFNVS